MVRMSLNDLISLLCLCISSRGTITVSIRWLNRKKISKLYVLKLNKNKAWFIKSFKKAGLKTIKINNNPIIEIDKI
jgi:hypothetical protein